MNERWIGPAFIVALLCALGMMVTYVFGGQTQLEGLFLGGAFLSIGAAMVLWGKHYMPNAEVVQERHDFESEPEEQEKFNELIGGTFTDVTRRKFLSRMGIAAMGALGIAALFPLRSLGPRPGLSLFTTDWYPGAYLVDHDGRRISTERLNVGAILTVFPENRNAEEDLRNDNAATLLIRVPQEQFRAAAGREGWIIDGNVAYSKVCTHVGCPVSLYRETTHELLCPCHQSTFDVLDIGRPVFGPAARPLPQLPLAVDSSGFLYAQSDYQEPIGPGFWNRSRDPRKEA